MYFWKKDCCGTVSLHSVIFLTAKPNSGIFFKCMKTHKQMCSDFFSERIAVQKAGFDGTVAHVQYEGKRWKSTKLPIQNCYMKDSAIHKHQVSSFLLGKLCRAALSRLAQLFCFHDIAKISLIFNCRNRSKELYLPYVCRFLHNNCFQHYSSCYWRLVIVKPDRHIGKFPFIYCSEDGQKFRISAAFLIKGPQNSYH